MRRAAFSVILVGLLASTVAGQSAATRPAEATPGTRPAEADRAASQPTTFDEAFQARIIKVVGRATYCLVDDAGVAGPWQPARPGDLLPAGTRVRTRLRSKLVLAFGEDAVVVVQALTLASIDQFHRAADSKVVRLGLGHGIVRAGVAETTLRSDMTIETPAATLSKRGTMDFGIQYEPSSQRFRVFLDREGLIQILNKMTEQSRTVRPGQYVTQAMQRWIDTASDDRWVPVVDTVGMTDAEAIFNTLQNTGLGVVEPGGGSTILTFSGRDIGELASALNAQRARGQAGPTVPAGNGIINRPEGNFGTGSGLGSGGFFKKRRAR